VRCISFEFLTFPDWNGINKDRVIVGIVSPVLGTGNKAFVLKNGVYAYYLAPGAFATEFNGINDRCDIVGEAFFPSTTSDGVGVLFRNGAFYSFSYPGARDTRIIWTIHSIKLGVVSVPS
jgi:hypothetical protein